MLDMSIKVAKWLIREALNLHDHMASGHSAFWRSAEFETNAFGVPVTEEWTSESWIDLHKTDECI